MKNKKVILLILILLVVGIWFFVWYLPNLGVAARVNGVAITKAVLDQNVRQAENMYKWQKQEVPNTGTLRENVLSDLINDTLVSQYASSHNIKVSESEINNRYLLTVGVFNDHNNVPGSSDNAFLARIREMYGIDKNQYLKIIRMDILNEKVQTGVGMPLAIWLTSQRKIVQISEY